MEIEEKLKIGIGIKETEKLKPGKVTIVTINIDKPKDREGNVIKSKQGKEFDEKVTFGCKHPDKDEVIEISSVKYLKNEKLVESGIWFHLDEDGLIPKNSALSVLLKHYNAERVFEMKNKELDSVLDEKGYLCIKAY